MGQALQRPANRVRAPAPIVRRRTKQTVAASETPYAPKGLDNRWYGLVEVSTSGGRVICHGSVGLQDLLEKGADLRRSFLTKTEAEAWLNEDDCEGGPTRAGQLPERNPEVRRRTVRGSTPMPLSNADDYHALEGLYESQRKYMGGDWSDGTKTQIHEMAIDHPQVLEAALCPTGLMEQQQGEFIERGVDVAGLPGTFSVTSMEDGDLYGDQGYDVATELSRQLANFAQEKKGYSSQWQTPKAHALSRVKSRETLGQMVEDVRKAWKCAREATEGQWRTYLYERRFLASDIVAYLQCGLLPNLMSDTYRRYYKLLCRAQDMLYESTGEVMAWKDSWAETYIRHHSEELQRVQMFASSYRHMLYRTYIYLWNSKRDDFYHSNMTTALWNQLRGIRDGANQDDAGTSTTPKSPSGGSAGRCKHCHRTGIHDAGKSNCPGKELTAQQARKLFKDVQKATATYTKLKAAGSATATKLREHPDTDTDELFKQLRKDHFGID